MVAKGRQKAALFSWRRSAEIYLDEILRIAIALPVNGPGAGRRSTHIANAQISHAAASHIVTLIASASAQGQGEE
jgi:hypothetical protein